MGNPKADEVKQWLIKSQRDLQSARVLLGSEQSLLDSSVLSFVVGLMPDDVEM